MVLEAARGMKTTLKPQVSSVEGLIWFEEIARKSDLNFAIDSYPDFKQELNRDSWSLASC